MRGLGAPLTKLVIFLVVTSFFTYVLAVTIANKSYGSTNTYHAYFSNAAGAEIGDDVRVAGVRVGSVTGIKIVDHNTADLKFSVVKSRPLPKTVQVYLRYRNLVGQRYLDIEQGPGNANDILPADGLVPLTQTHNALDLTVLFQGFKPLFEGLDADQINNLSTEIVQTLQGEGGSFQLLFTNLAELTNSIADKDEVIGSVVDNLSSLLTAIGQHDAQLSNLIVQLQSFVTGLNTDKSTILDSIDGVNDLATSTAGLLTDIRPALAKDVVDLSALTGNLARNSSTLNDFLDHLPTTTAALIRTGSYGSWFNFYLCTVQVQLVIGDQTLTSAPTAIGDKSRCQ